MAMETPEPFRYERRQLTRVLDAGPERDNTHYRLQVSGRLSTKWLMISAAQLRALIDLYE